MNPAIVITLLSAIAYGLWPPTVRAVYAHGGNVMFVVLASSWIRGLAMALFCVVTRRALFQTRAITFQAFHGGLFQALAVWGIYKAVEILPGPVAIIIIFSHTIMLLLFMAWRGEITLDRVTVLSTISALFGLSFVVDVWHTQTVATWVGVAWGFGAALATVSRLYMFGKQTQERHPIVVGAENFVAAAMWLTPLMFFIRPQMPDASGLSWFVVATSASTIGSFTMFYAISLIGSFRYSLFLKMEPVFTSLFSVLLIHEILKPQQYVGMILVLASLVTYQVLEHRKKASIAA